MAIKPHIAPCGTCGGSGKVYEQTEVVVTKRYLDHDTGEWIPEVKEMQVIEKDCKGPGPH